MMETTDNEGWVSYLNAARRKVEIARYHLEQLERLRLVPPLDGPRECPVPIQAHFEGVVISVMAAVDQTAQAINSALNLGARESQLFDKAFGAVTAAVPALKTWCGKPIGRDLRGVRRSAIHHSYEKTPDGPLPRWRVEESSVRYEGSRELRVYGEAAVAHAEELIRLIPAIQSELRRRLAATCPGRD
jgi:hypothetical protein